MLNLVIKVESAEMSTDIFSKFSKTQEMQLKDIFLRQIAIFTVS